MNNKRRISVAALMVLLTLVPGAIGIVTADWPFWKRVLTLPSGAGEWPDAFYAPTVRIAGAPAAFFAAAEPGTTSIDAGVLAEAAAWAKANNSHALLVWHRGRIQLEQYAVDGGGADALVSGRRMSSVLAAMAVGVAIERGKIASLDAPVSTWLHEWRGEARGRITLRQLLWHISGLEPSAVRLGREISGSFGRVIEWADILRSNDMRLRLSGNFAEAALAFRAVHQAGLVFELSDANAQLVGVILERAVGLPFERVTDEWLWRPIGAGVAEFYVDRPRGMPAVYCCLKASARDWLRLGALLVNDGGAADVQVLPAGWVRTMLTGSRVNPEYGLFVPLPTSTATPADMRDAVRLGGAGRTLWAVPSQQLVIVHMSSDATDVADDALLTRIVRGIRD